MGNAVASCAAALLTLAACREHAAAPPDAGTSIAASTSPSPLDAAPSGPARAPSARAPEPCKAIGTSGRIAPLLEAGVTPIPIHVTDPLPAHTWLVLGDGAHLTTKDPRTGRELSFEGPARVQPCRPIDASGRDDEEVHIANGTFTSMPGSGEAPGQEEWVVTPLAVVRYSAAALKVVVSGTAGAARVRVRAGAGTAYIFLEDDVVGVVRGGDAGDPHWRRLDIGATLDLRQDEERWRAPERGSAGELQTRAAVRWCADSAELPTLLEGPVSPESAASDVEWRQVTRAECAVAALRATDLLDPARSERGEASWEARLARARVEARSLRPSR